MSTILRINWLNLKRDRVALGLTFVLPIVFFSIFAYIFGSVAKSSGGGGGSGGGPTAMEVAVADEDASDISRRFVKAIDDQEALNVVAAPPAKDGVPAQPFDRDSARKAVRGGEYPVAIIIPAGFHKNFGNFGGDRAEVELIYDEANPIAQHTVAGLLQAASFTAAPDILMEKGFGQLEQFGGALTPAQRKLIDQIRPQLRGDKPWEDLDRNKDEGAATTAPATQNAGGSSGFGGLIAVNAIPARQEQKDDGIQPSNIIAYYAAGIGVMFLLFSMAGAGGFLLEQEEMGVLERLLVANVGMTRLLTGSWLFFAIIGTAQLALMFTFAAVVFHLDLFTPKHLVGCGLMIVFTAMAAAAFAMILATLARSRAQLGGMSTIIILIMSALGGSMVPRFVAPGVFDTTSKFTFNGWALDGFLKVFWYDDPAATLPQAMMNLWPQLLAMTLMTVVFLFISRLLARRWEAA